MIVRCASCNTEFALDDRQVGPDGASVRCLSCAAVFRVSASDVAAQPPWQVRTIDDLLFTAPDLATLRAWILEGRLHPDDRVSRSGRHFVRLGEMPEFATAFAGFPGLPSLVEPRDRPPSERSALDLLGPPPAFGTHAGEDDSAALAGVPEPAATDRSSALEQVVSRAAASSASAHPVLGEAVEGTGEIAIPTMRAPAKEIERSSASASSVAAVERERAAPVPPPAPRSGTLAPPRSGATPTAVHDDRSGRALSMLDVVTHHVRPITGPSPEGARRPAAPAPPPPPPAAAAGEAATVPRGEPVAAPALQLEPSEPRRRRGAWPVWAALGILAGAAVVFGIPQVRARVFGTPLPTEAAVAEPVRDDAPLLADADAAITAADPTALARADAALEVAKAGGASALGDAQAEVLATRALVHELWGAVDPAMRADARFWAQEDAGRAAGLLDAAAGDGTSRRTRAAVLLRVAQGRSEADGLALADEPELSALLAAAPLLRDAKAELSGPARDALQSLARPTTLARLVLALDRLHAGDRERARAIAEAVLAQAPGQPVARAIVRALEQPATVAQATPDAVAPVATTVVEPTAGQGTAPEAIGESPDRLIDRGCRKSESGDAPGAIALLRKALEKKPGDLDGLLCLGDAYSRSGAYDNALKSYAKLLERSPNMMSGLQGAGKAAAKLGRTAKAVGYYKRLLEHDPSHAQARAYVDAHAGEADGAGDAGETG